MDNSKKYEEMWRAAGFESAPRQDQIQEMMFSEKEGVQTIAHRLANFSTRLTGSSISTQGTMEQLWLAYYMQEKHNMIWDKEEWKDNE